MCAKQRWRPAGQCCLPRLTVIANRLFALIGLYGRAVLPMVLGLGCVTMATLTTRILHSPRERLTAYGLAASRPIKVLQQRPMMVILADEIELALEHAVARHIWVEKDVSNP